MKPTTKICETCGNTREWHAEFNPRHVFNRGEVSAAQTFGRRMGPGTRSLEALGKDKDKDDGVAQVEVTQMQWPFDPVLRQALFTKGLLTPEDLTAAERTILAITGRSEETPDVSSTAGPGPTDV